MDVKPFYTILLGAWCEYGSADEAILCKEIFEIGLSTRAAAVCRRAVHDKIGGNSYAKASVFELLNNCTVSDLLDTRNCGTTTLAEIVRVLAKYNLRLRNF